MTRKAGNWRPRLIVMVKEPVMGRVKTRLARVCGAVSATAFLRTNLGMTLKRLSQDPRWQTILSVAPARAVQSPMFPEHITRMGQGRGDLGQRMSHVARHAPPGPLIIIGADVPAIGADDIAKACSALNRADAVFGPAGDGGYWLVGLAPRMRRAPVFESVRWSSPHALADTLANLAGSRVLFVASKDDVDDGVDLIRHGARAQRLML